MDPSNIAQLLSGIFAGSAGLSQLGQAGTNAAAGAAAADPFASQRAGYQGVISPFFTGTNQQIGIGAGTMSNIVNALGQVVPNVNLSGNSTYAGQLSSLMATYGQQATGLAAGNSVQPISSAISGSAGNLQQQVNALSSNYMADPAIQAQYQLGLQSAERGIQASGYGASGQAMKELSDYGQQFASSAYQQQLSDILQTNQQAFGQNTAAAQLQAAFVGQNFNQALQGLSLGASTQGQASQLFQGLEGLNLNAQQSTIGNRLSELSTMGSLQGSANATTGQLQQGLLNSLLTLSGASTGSPSTAGAILSGQFANTNTALGNLGSGITGAVSGLDQLLGSATGAQGSSGIGNVLSNLFSDAGSYGSALGGGISQFIDQLGGGVGDLATNLGSSTAGGFESLLAGGADSGISSGLSSLFGL